MWHWWKGSVHHGDGLFINHLCGERDKGSGRAPLINPRGPARKSVLRTALTSRVPDCGRLDSTYSFHSGTRPCLGSPLSAIPGVQTLSFPLRFADFSGDTTPIAVISQIKKNGVAETLPDGAALIGPTECRVRWSETDKTCVYLDNPLTLICLVSNFICNY
jgi:hypothetical protein